MSQLTQQRPSSVPMSVHAFEWPFRVGILMAAAVFVLFHSGPLRCEMRRTFGWKSFVLIGFWLSQSEKHYALQFLKVTYIRISCHAFQDEQIDASRKDCQAKENKEQREEHIARLIGKPLAGLGRDKITKPDCGN